MMKREELQKENIVNLLYGKREWIVRIVLLFMIVTYFGAVCIINFEANPNFYTSDMYSDIIFATEAWAHKSFFPDGWVFGNQFYVAATPMLSALFYGILGLNPGESMALASTVYTILVIWSFNWMLKPVVQSLNARLFGSIVFMSLGLCFGDAVYSFHGWQLLFTMCSYYACYAVAAFMGFGCYLRAERGRLSKLIIPLLCTCILAFSMGMQSLRQTAVMVIPLMAAEVVQVLYRIYCKKKIFSNTLLVTILISVSNIVGLIVASRLEINQITIFGDTRFYNGFDYLPRLKESLFTMLSLLVPVGQEGTRVQKIMLLLLLLLVVYVLYLCWKEKNIMAGNCLLLLIVSVLSILAIGVFMTMIMGERYYFMIYPLICFLLAFIYSRKSEGVRLVILGCLLCIFIYCCNFRLSYICTSACNEEDYYMEVGDYLRDNNITTVYTSWNLGDKIAAASDWEIEAAFWVGTFDQRVNYLCNPDVFEAENESCAYVFGAKEEVDKALEIAKTKNVSLTLDKYFPQSDIYVYKASGDLMTLFGNAR